jgi:hypothetical protein
MPSLIQRFLMPALAGLLGTVTVACAQRGEIVDTVGGDPVYQVLPAGAIPAIDDPEFLTGAEADAQMSPQEPILGVVLGREARAYSLWQLDAHEIVNDSIGESPFAVTW